MQTTPRPSSEQTNRPRCWLKDTPKMSGRSVAMYSLSVAQSRQLLCRVVTRTNDPFPDRTLYDLVNISLPVFVFIRTFDQIKEYRWLYVKEVFLYKKSDPVGHEFFVFAIYDRGIKGCLISSCE